MKETMKKLLPICLEAGEEIMRLYNTHVSTSFKEDDSPVTEADTKANRIIAAGLEQLDSSIPILSEEGQHIPVDERKAWSRFWLVDPLDGTKEFLKKNDEFTVNIALIEGDYPTAGIIYAPALDECWFAFEGNAYKLEQASAYQGGAIDTILERAIPLPMAETWETVRIAASRSHLSAETETFISQKEKFHTVDFVSRGSSLKFCLTAEGKADYYPRYAPTMEWDTAAGQAIVEAAGGRVETYAAEKRMNYNKESLINDWFLVTAKSAEEKTGKQSGE
ncbi:3'(2'),5'-bisphosphate nucleotidase CysQ [Alkalicoccus saliphilus]|uniref:3'(2'),5'-bisphosphate nucleotidase CysQ n=1 Tax=Alkalicoccus saliphilus TaxID=200989 RepID=A0A2T4U3E2_9BACI|nr:3'(2'),5'-bisphosphate nucleotidase CysQ [Alkalicoccus saliphilus]PTL37917.1 3'(2'),5'-bisphosphate nucleotidase [Alkalicoccus saliphilus]